MRDKIIDDGPGGRNIIVGADGEPDRVGLPLQHANGACTDEEKRVLMRWIEASEMSKGNYAVAIIDGEPRGRYAEFHRRLDVTAYAKFEVDAYRWIQAKAFGRENMTLAEIFARMSGERVEVDFVKWGALVANTDNPDLALGAAIGTARALAWALKDAYRDYYHHWQTLREAARLGRQLTEGETERRVRRNDAVGRAIRHHSRPIIDG